MKLPHIGLWLGSAIVAAFVAGCTPAIEQSSASKGGKSTAVVVDDALVQFGLVAALAAGDYADGPPLNRVLADGDFGVGTFGRLDGEMILLDGRIYQALSDGAIRAANLDDTSPFAAVTFFEEDGREENLSAATLDELDQQLDKTLPHRNAPYALRIDGEFATLTLRSVPAQSPPFQPLVEVVKHQTTWRQEKVKGTLVGIRCPQWVGTLNVAGYHWHFLSEDRTVGGHVLGCDLTRGLLRYDECTSLVIQLPQSRAFDAFDSGTINGQDIDRVERQRH